MRMDFNALKSYLINLREQERIVLSFSHIETLCGTISRSYIDNRDFDRRYAFHKHIEEVGYRIVHPVDYENRVMYLEQIPESNDRLIAAPAVTARQPFYERNQDFQRNEYRACEIRRQWYFPKRTQADDEPLPL